MNVISIFGVDGEKGVYRKYCLDEVMLGVRLSFTVIDCTLD